MLRYATHANMIPVSFQCLSMLKFLISTKHKVQLRVMRMFYLVIKKQCNVNLQMAKRMVS